MNTKQLWSLMTGVIENHDIIRLMELRLIEALTLWSDARHMMPNPPSKTEITLVVAATSLPSEDWELVKLIISTRIGNRNLVRSLYDDIECVSRYIEGESGLADLVLAARTRKALMQAAICEVLEDHPDADFWDVRIILQRDDYMPTSSNAWELSGYRYTARSITDTDIQDALAA